MASADPVGEHHQARTLRKVCSSQSLLQIAFISGSEGVAPQSDLLSHRPFRVPAVAKIENFYNRVTLAVSEYKERGNQPPRTGRIIALMDKEGAPDMKISFDIDCTPDELRGFFGLPDVTAMQQQLLKEVEERMRANLTALDPETMLKTWLPTGLKGFEQLQEMFLGQMAGQGGRGAGKK